MYVHDVWHTTYGVGTIVSIHDGCVTISFSSGICKTFSSDFWGVSLFTSEEDYLNLSETEKYKKYKNFKTNVTHITDRNLAARINSKLKFPSFDDITTRNIVLICVQPARQRGRLHVIGIDVFTAMVVNIVDTNGSPDGLHTRTSQFEDLTPMTVIQARFKFFNNSHYLNTLRIVSDIKILGQSNLTMLLEKYTMVNNPRMNPVVPFDDVFKFLQFHKDSCEYFLVNFTGTRIKYFHGHFQLKMDTHYVNIYDHDFRFNPYFSNFSGLALLQVNCSPEGKMRFAARKIFGRFIDNSELEHIRDKHADAKQLRRIRKKQSRGTFFKQYSADEMGYWADQSAQETQDYYEDYQSDLMEEYSEYNDNFGYTDYGDPYRERCEPNEDYTPDYSPIPYYVSDVHDDAFATDFDNVCEHDYSETDLYIQARAYDDADPGARSSPAPDAHQAGQHLDPDITDYDGELPF